MPSFAHLRDETLRGRLADLRSVVEPILAGNYLPSFTDHSIHHSDRLCCLVDRLVKGKEALREIEAFVLYSACYLHDIGLQHQRGSNTQAVCSVLQRPQYAGRRWEDLEIATRQLIVREVHHRISGELVRQSIDTPQPVPLGIQLTQDWHPGQIASLCVAHCLDVNSDEYRELTQDWGGFRMSFLAGVLRLGDILDESRRRSHLYLEQTRELDLESRTHWWRCYYVADVTIDAGAGQITLWFDFPAQRRAQYDDLMKPLQVPSIEAELARQAEPLARHNCQWHLRVADTPVAQSTAKPMDHDLERYIAEKHAKEREARAEQERLAVLDQLKLARPTVERAFDELQSRKASMGTDDYLGEHVALAKHLWALGGRRRAWMSLWGEYGSAKSSVCFSTRLHVAVELADMMLEDDSADQAVRVLHDLRVEGEALSDGDPLKWRFFRLLGRAYDEQCAFADAAETLLRAEQLAPNAKSRALMEAQLVELLMMKGELDRVTQICDGREKP